MCLDLYDFGRAGGEQKAASLRIHLPQVLLGDLLGLGLRQGGMKDLLSTCGRSVSLARASAGTVSGFFGAGPLNQGKAVRL